jgi:hypothetical protein
MRETLLARVRREPVAALSREELAELLASVRELRREETGTSGPIRVIEVGGSVAVQEETPSGQVLVRIAASRAAADHFVDDRLAVYERMWNGCGCRVDYDRP